MIHNLFAVHEEGPRSPRANQYIEVGFAFLAAIFLCVASLSYFKGSASLTSLVPFVAALTVSLLVRAWPSLSFDQSTLVGLVLMVVGCIFWYIAVQAADPGQKSDYKNIALALLSGGAGVFVGQRLPQRTKRNENGEK